MKRTVLMIAALAALMLSGCADRADSQPDEQTAAVTGEQTTAQSAETEPAAPSETTASAEPAAPEYDIETAFPDALFVRIIEGDVTPAEVTYGEGGEQGYLTYSSQDPAMIADFIAGFRAIQISEEITDPEAAAYTADGINDFTFSLDDGNTVTVSLDAMTRAHTEGAVYILEGTSVLNDARMKIQNPAGAPEVPVLPAD